MRLQWDAGAAGGHTPAQPGHDKMMQLQARVPIATGAGRQHGWKPESLESLDGSKAGPPAAGLAGSTAQPEPARRRSRLPHAGAAGPHKMTQLQSRTPNVTGAGVSSSLDWIAGQAET